jgi:DNA alkylation damage repair protein AlkB
MNPERGIVEISPGAYHLPSYLTSQEQLQLVIRCRELGTQSTGFYQPTVRGGAKMRIEMLCLGRHWNPMTYSYESTRSDYDGQAVPPLPADLSTIAERVATAVGCLLEPDICILNYYPPNGRLSLHQDKDEHPETLRAGIPIVSLSVGNTAQFVLGGMHRKDQTQTIALASGDALVLAGPSRLRYHGVSRILSESGPKELNLNGRFNLTFRRY